MAKHAANAAIDLVQVMSVYPIFLSNFECGKRADAVFEFRDGQHAVTYWDDLAGPTVEQRERGRYIRNPHGSALARIDLIGFKAFERFAICRNRQDSHPNNDPRNLPGFARRRHRNHNRLRRNRKCHNDL